MPEETLKLLQRIKNTQDGKDFIEYLLNLSKNNYRSWKAEGGEILRGKALILDKLVEDFDLCDEKLRPVSKVDEWM